ncbi:olfactory receptor class A-like protein 4 [Nothobranchius furzeri]|uniref:Neuropeptide Y receptor type 2-like n=1 Tax=Nothobranchius furzeri TaxID=105023 RepID=A0A9D3BG71_NOTFU|nr:neuropeptide Y receptor type 2-like [Nothobranchius furzeri]
MSEVLTVDAVLFGILVFSGILGNILVIYVVFLSASESPARRLAPSDTLLVHLSLANLLTSLFRTVPIFVSDLGLEVSLSAGLCRLFMLLWVWWRAVGCWMTLMLSIFHCTTLRRQHVTFGPLVLQKERRQVWAVVGLVWGANFFFSTPALAYTTHVHSNATVKLMVISCTTRPLLGCIWEFPSTQQGSAFASTSLALNEILPLMLMIFTNLGTLHALSKHIRAVRSGTELHGELNKHVSAERKAAHVIMCLVLLFVVCWTLQVAAVTYYNYDRGRHAERLLTVAHFSASLFVGFSPLVVALGHGKLRRKIKCMFLVWANVQCYKKETKNGSDSPKSEEKPSVSVELKRNKVKNKVQSNK